MTMCMLVSPWGRRTGMAVPKATCWCGPVVVTVATITISLWHWSCVCGIAIAFDVLAWWCRHCHHCTSHVSIHCVHGGACWHGHAAPYRRGTANHVHVGVVVTSNMLAWPCHQCRRGTGHVHVIVVGGACWHGHAATVTATVSLWHRSCAHLHHHCMYWRGHAASVTIAIPLFHTTGTFGMLLSPWHWTCAWWHRCCLQCAGRRWQCRHGWTVVCCQLPAAAVLAVILPRLSVSSVWAPSLSPLLHHVATAVPAIV